MLRQRRPLLASLAGRLVASGGGAGWATVPGQRRSQLSADPLGRTKTKMPRARDIEVELRFLTTAEGGRKGPAFSGYRSQFFYDGHDWDAVHEYPDCRQVDPGDTVRAYLAFLSPQEHVGKLFPGTRFQCREGTRVIAEGRVLRILELEESARRDSAGELPRTHD